MKQLHAPWRIQFVEGQSGAKSKGCVLCSMPKETDQESVQVLDMGTHSYVVMNKFPYSNGHLMIVPFGHERDLTKLEPMAMNEIFAFAQRAVRILQQVLKPEGFNLGMNLGKAAGAGIEEHLHLHIVPRWNGDTNFMPVLGDVKVIPEHLEATYQKILRAWKEDVR